MKLFKMCFCSIIWNIEDTSECTFKNISSSRDACNLEDVLWFKWPFPVLSKKCPCVITDCLLWTTGRAGPIQAQFITISCEGWPCEQRSACMFSGICSPLLRLVTERHACPWLVALQSPLTFPAAQQRDLAEAQVTRSADGSSVSAFSLVPSSTKLFPAVWSISYLLHLQAPSSKSTSQRTSCLHLSLWV